VVRVPRAGVSARQAVSRRRPGTSIDEVARAYPLCRTPAAGPRLSPGTGFQISSNFSSARRAPRPSRNR
jgi:hypothetical protein